MLHKFGLFIFLLSLIISCGDTSTSGKNEDVIVKKDSVNESQDKCTVLFNEAKRLDNILLKANTVNNGIAEQAINAFFLFATNCKGDTLAPVFLIKAGQVAQTIRKYTQAQDFFTKCIDEFPKFKSRGAAMFLLAQLYDDASILNNESEARTLYDQIIREYPKSSYASDAKACIQNIGKTDEQLVHEFLKKNKQ